MPPAFEWIVMKPLKMGDQVLEPGHKTVIPNTWPYRTLLAYVDGGYLERGELLADQVYEQPSTSHAPRGYDHLKPVPPPRLAGIYRDDVWIKDQPGDRRFRSKDPLTWIRCWNCLAQCFVPKDLDKATRYECPTCHQVQTKQEAMDRWVPSTNLERPSEFVGVHDHPGSQPRSTGTEDLTDSWKARVS